MFIVDVLQAELIQFCKSDSEGQAKLSERLKNLALLDPDGAVTCSSVLHQLKQTLSVGLVKVVDEFVSTTTP